LKRRRNNHRTQVGNACKELYPGESSYPIESVGDQAVLRIHLSNHARFSHELLEN
jgi:hypothetical protein